jgi:hypothetical protein
MVLHDISNNSKLIKIPAAAFGTERLFERDLHIVYVVPVPRCAKELVTKSQDQDILAQVVINTENLLLMPVWL